jgi:hypothetical protein
MNKEKLNEIMNCQCLQIIIENDKNKHSIELEREMVTERFKYQMIIVKLC